MARKFRFLALDTLAGVRFCAVARYSRYRNILFAIVAITLPHFITYGDVLNHQNSLYLIEFCLQHFCLLLAILSDRDDDILGPHRCYVLEHRFPFPRTACKFCDLDQMAALATALVILTYTMLKPTVWTIWDIFTHHSILLQPLGLGYQIRGCIQIT